MKEPLALCWNGQSLGQITEAGWSDWPWASGKLAIGNLPVELRTVLEWFSRQANRDELEDPPFDTQFLEGWSIVGADGDVTEASVPVVDFESGTAEWR